MNTPIIVSGWHLVYEKNMQPVFTNTVFDRTPHDGDKVVEVQVVGGLPPHKPDSAGYVLVTAPGATPAPNNTDRFYAHVFDCKWVRMLPLSWFECRDLSLVCEMFTDAMGDDDKLSDQVELAKAVMQKLKPYV